VFFLRLLSFLPLPILYLLSDFLCFINFRIIQYRKEIIKSNLEHAFPEKSEAELNKIRKQFYKNLADTAVETLKLLTISEQNLLKRVQFETVLILQYHDLRYSVFGMTPHFCNWEWLLAAGTNQLGLPVHAAYQRLRSPFFNKLMLAIRSRFGAVMHEKNDVVKDLISLKGKSYFMSMVADQRPYSGENKYWSVFLHRDAAFYTGTELMARRMGIKVVYVSMKRVKRGFYKVSFEEIELSPETSRPGEITEKFILLTERDIRDDPASYLWSHDRWKHKKPKK